MPKLGGTFNPDDYDVNIPEGEYIFKITETSLEDTKSGGKMIVLACQIIDGEYSGEVILQRCNVKNANPTAERIGCAELAKFARATCGAFEETEQMHDIPFKASVIIQKDRSGQYDDQAVIRRPEALDEDEMPEGDAKPKKAPAKRKASAKKEPPTRKAPAKKAPAKRKAPEPEPEEEEEEETDGYTEEEEQEEEEEEGNFWE